MALLNSVVNEPAGKHAEPGLTVREDLTLRDCAQRAAKRYLSEARGAVVDLHHLFVSEVERALFTEAMAHSHGNISRAALLVGVSRHTLRKKLVEFDIPH
jgi:Fis family transcriptional regulator